MKIKDSSLAIPICLCIAIIFSIAGCLYGIQYQQDKDYKSAQDKVDQELKRMKQDRRELLSQMLIIQEYCELKSPEIFHEKLTRLKTVVAWE